ncbi:MAG: type IX secretion system outer membrane channel protein PorV [Ignavibacteriae bacterium]|nr:type IX secretion system outer membrane channel protein PorV [Ignavibacteriota bacterium]
MRKQFFFTAPKQLVAVILLVLASAGTLQAQNVQTTAVPFLLIAPNSRASGMGEAGVAMADDGWAVFWNPSGLAFQNGSEVSLSRADWLPKFGLPDLWISHAVYKQEIEELDGTIGAGLTYLNLGEILRTGSGGPDVIDRFQSYEFALVAGYGTLLDENLGIGINARLIHSNLSPFGTEQEQGKGVATGFSFDVGMLYKPQSVPIPFTDYDIGGRLNLGFNLSNIGPNLTYIDEAQADALPMTLRVGLAANLYEDQFNSLTYLADFNKLLVRKHPTVTKTKYDPFYKAFFTAWSDKSFGTELKEIVIGTGMEYWYGDPKFVGMRFGYFYDEFGPRKFLTFGAGVRYDVYGFDFSYIAASDQHPLADTIRFTLLILWGGATL